MNLKPRRKVMVSEVVPLQRQTVQGLVSAIETLFAGKDKPTRILYQKGEDLQVEIPRLMDAETEELGLDSGLLTPYQIVRQYCELDIIEADKSDPLHLVCSAVADLRKQGMTLAGVVVAEEAVLTDWLRNVSLTEVFGVSVYVDTQAPSNTVFLCGSSKGALIRDFERATAFVVSGD